VAVAGPIPFLFCRYELTVDDEPLDARAQLTSLKELQGKFYPHGPSAERRGLFDSVVMRPRSFTLDDDTILTWSVGQVVGRRVAVHYNRNRDDLDRATLDDDSLRYADFVAVPRLGVLAVDDRHGEEYLGGAIAAHRFRSIFRQLDGADAIVTPAAEYADVQRALDQWTVTSFGFTIRPVNPHAPSAIARKLANALKERKVAKARGQWVAEPGEGIEPDNEMKAIIDLTEAGYGQISLKGMTKEGHSAEIKKSPFYESMDKNLQSLRRPKELRVTIDTEELSDRQIQRAVATILRNFYG
jgi:hypothetical protein